MIEQNKRTVSSGTLILDVHSNHYSDFHPKRRDTVNSGGQEITLSYEEKPAVLRNALL